MNVKRKINNLNIENKGGFNTYLFGSSVYSDNPGDIDIAIIYDKEQVSIDEAVEFRSLLRDQISNSFNCSCDALLLSEVEEKQVEFLENAKTELLFTEV